MVRRVQLCPTIPQLPSLFSPRKHVTMPRMNELSNQIERLQGRVHETMVRL